MSDDEIIQTGREAFERIEASPCSRKIKCECPIAVKERDLVRVIDGFDALSRENQKLRMALLQNRIDDAEPPIEEGPRIVPAVPKVV
jgi:hypothetical protein